jgi:hypothetical protein
VDQPRSSALGQRSTLVGGSSVLKMLRAMELHSSLDPTRGPSIDPDEKKEVTEARAMCKGPCLFNSYASLDDNRAPS